LRCSYRYYKLVGDDVHIAKTVARIAHVYLERVFAPVAFLEQRLDDVARIKLFSPPRRGVMLVPVRVQRVCVCSVSVGYAA
jgi:hypothetical protein